MTDAPAPTSPGRMRLAMVAFGLGIAGFAGGLPYLPLYGIGFAFVASPGWGTYLLGLCAVAAVVLGPIALRRCERQRRRGSLLALAGLVVGSLGLPGLLMAVSLIGVHDMTGIRFDPCW
ncbi:DUF4190 domain-containing protein [Cryptosporangium minutisporangium]|uniref:DUF4190 domain-containing protein n=1 Tax=Cryptosporangium minutisporangium TaxID=113569 RepID=A0ABP6T6B4_9ACTN